MKKLILSLSLLCLSAPAMAQDGKSPFCDAVNAQKKACQTMRIDCSHMMGDMDAATLDTIDQIKSCPVYDEGTSALQSPATPQDLAKLVCCLGSGLR